MKQKKWLVPLYSFTAVCWWIRFLTDLAAGADWPMTTLAGFCAVVWTFCAAAWIARGRRDKANATEETDHESETPERAP